MTVTHTSAAPARAAIVTTLRGAAPVLDSFIRYHVALGFAHLYLFFDDQDDPALAIAGRHDPAHVSVFVRGSDLDAQWRECVQFAWFAPHLAQEVMARQCLNVEVACRRRSGRVATGCCTSMPTSCSIALDRRRPATSAA